MAGASGLAYSDAETIKFEVERNLKIKLNETGFPAPSGNTTHFFTNPLKGTDLLFIDNADTNTQLFALSTDSYILTAFRGTQPDNFQDQMEDLFTDIKAGLEIFPLDKANSKIKVHRGFKEGFLSIQHELRIFLRNRQEGKQIWFTGHSLGGALAAIAILDFNKKIKFENKPNIYTFGQPRTGDWNFRGFFDSNLSGRAFRVHKNNDLVSYIPPPIFYRHAGNRIYIDRNNKLSPGLSILEIRKDRARGFLGFILKNGVKLFLKRFLRFPLKLDSIVGDHSVVNYAKSFKQEFDGTKDVRKKISQLKKIVPAAIRLFVAALPVIAVWSYFQLWPYSQISLYFQ